MTVEDVRSLDQSIGDDFFKEGGVPGTFKIDIFQKNWEMLLINNFGVMWKLCLCGEIAGLLGALLSPDFNDAKLVATETFWYVLPKYRGSLWGIRLLTTFEKWAKNIGASRIHMTHLMKHAPDKMQRFYEKRGYTASEIHYSKEL